MFEFCLEMILVDKEYDDIEFGRTKKICRSATTYWLSQIKTVAMTVDNDFVLYSDATILLQKTYRKNRPTMKFKIQKIMIEQQEDAPMIVIEIGERIE